MPSLLRLVGAALAVAVAIPFLTAVEPSPADASEILRSVDLPGAPTEVAIAPDGSRAWVTHEAEDLLSVVDVAAGVLVTSLPIPGGPRSVTVSRDGTKVYVGSVEWETSNEGHGISIVDAARSEVIGYFPQAWTPRHLSVSPDDRYLVASSDVKVTVFSTSTRARLRVIELETETGRVEFGTAPNIGHVVSGSGYRGLWTIDVSTGAKKSRVEQLSSDGNRVAVTPDGIQGYVMGWGTLRRGDLIEPNGLIETTIPSKREPVMTVDGLRLVTVDPDRDGLLVSRVASGALEQTIAVPSPGTAAIAADSRTVVVPSYPSSVAVLDLGPVPTPAEVAVTRLAGASRYDTAAEIAEFGYPDGASTVFIATGENFPDALSAAPAAAAVDAPLRLVRRGSVPQRTMDELARLSPSRIVVVGGTAIISEDVLGALRTVAPTIRLAGANRYATSRAIVDYAFGESGAAELFVATGEAFPDALSASAAAGVSDAPVLLVDGSHPRMAPDGNSVLDLGSETKALLERLASEHSTVVGGPAVFSRLSNHSFGLSTPSWVERIWGMNRYSTSSRIVGRAAPSATTTFIATGTGFPDALAGAALSGALGAPLYLVPMGCIPQATLFEIATNGTERLVVLGGENAVSTTAAELTPCG
ncbi:cell wall-binding repeat-containing protein [Agromyces sp. ZXT2-3]|uniref:cell wall-binding repeat-containing protein n=1 Tax=Agromyces sp. ZXT2-3 TaxID=3461152 RepID=UPI004054B5F3